MLALLACAAARANAAPAPGLPPIRCGAPPLPAHADALDRAIVRAMTEGHIPGLSVVVLDRGRVVKLRSYGFADLESCAPATDATLFGIGSVSKQLTAAGVLTLVRDGAIALDDPITKYLPEGEGVWDAIRVRHLLTHTSGIPDYCGDDEKYPSISLDRASSPTTAALLRRIAKARLNFRPGEEALWRQMLTPRGSPTAPRSPMASASSSSRSAASRCGSTAARSASATAPCSCASRSAAWPSSR